MSPWQSKENLGKGLKAEWGSWEIIDGNNHLKKFMFPAAIRGGKSGVSRTLVVAEDDNQTWF